jgi:hypothetical protein
MCTEYRLSVTSCSAHFISVEGSSVRLGYSRNFHTVCYCACMSLVAGLLRPRLFSSKLCKSSPAQVPTYMLQYRIPTPYQVKKFRIRIHNIDFNILSFPLRRLPWFSLYQCFEGSRFSSDLPNLRKSKIISNQLAIQVNRKVPNTM